MGKSALAMAIVLLLALSSSACTAEEEAHTASVFAMDTHITLTAYGSGAQQALDRAQALITEREQLWSVTLESSDTGQINRAGGEAVQVSQATADLLARALDMADYTGGAYDPTIYPVVAAWGFTTDEYRVPSGEELEELTALVDYLRVQLSGCEVELEDGMQLDLGGIAKGYVGDELAALMRQQGVTSALINLGGNVQTVGGKPDGSAWRIGIRSPEGEGMLGVLEARDLCVITSGAYERYFTAEDGTIYGHIIDPDTGRPVNNGVLSVTVVGSEGSMCDALSTALFVMGTEGACEFWRAHTDFDMILLSDDGTLYVTEGLTGAFEVSESALISEVRVLER